MPLGSPAQVLKKSIAVSAMGSVSSVKEQPEEVEQRRSTAQVMQTALHGPRGVSGTRPGFPFGKNHRRWSLKVTLWQDDRSGSEKQGILLIWWLRYEIDYSLCLLHLITYLPIYTY